MMRVAELVTIWIFSGPLFSAPAIFIALGTYAAIFDPGTSPNVFIAFAGGGLIGLGLAFPWLIMVSPVIIAVCATWPLLVRCVPGVETPRGFVGTILVMTSLLILAEWNLLQDPQHAPGNPSFPFLVILLSLLLPRLLVKKLRPGAFLPHAA